VVKREERKREKRDEEGEERRIGREIRDWKIFRVKRRSG